MPAPDLPAHLPVPVEWLESVASTNEEAFLRAGHGASGPLWIAARLQTSGRGRSGRAWVSPPGNLYASLLLTFPRALPTVPQLSLVAGLAVHQTIHNLAPLLTFRLKWPNDVLFGDAKLAGILIEGRTSATGAEHQVVVGCGLNLAHHPVIAGRRTSSLAALGVSAKPEQALAFLSTAFAQWLNVWREGAGLPEICRAWMERALPIGTQVTVNAGSDLMTGPFVGLDQDGAMLLGLGSGHRRITFGDVDIHAPTGAGPLGRLER